MTPMPNHHWVFRARALRVIDGDTVDVEIDQGLHCRRIERLRLLGVNTPEMQKPTREAGEAAKAFTSRWVVRDGLESDPFPLVIQTVKADVFGRYLADIWRLVDGEHLNEALVEAGHAVRVGR